MSDEVEIFVLRYTYMTLLLVLLQIQPTDDTYEVF
jgi:hypothetical protein